MKAKNLEYIADVPSNILPFEFPNGKCFREPSHATLTLPRKKCSRIPSKATEKRGEAYNMSSTLAPRHGSARPPA